MANKRISELTTITGANLADADLLVVVDVSDTTMASSGTNKKITMAELAKDSALTDNLVAKSTLTTDGDVLTRAAGAPARITRADLAQDSAFSSRYVAKTDADMVWIDAGQMTSTLGSPTLGRFADTYFFGGWLLDSASAEIVSFSTILPKHWATFKTEIYWANDGAGSGDVAWTLFGRYMQDGDNVSTGPTAWAFNVSPDPTIVAADSNNIVNVTALDASSTLTPGQPVIAYIGRVGDNGSDTLNNDCALIGVLFTRLS